MVQMFNNKKGFFGVFGFALSLIFGAPWIAFGIAIFLALLLLGFYFALGEILGAFLVVFGGYLTYKLSWKIGVPIMAAGSLFFYNPFGWETLSMVGWSS